MTPELSRVLSKIEIMDVTTAGCLQLFWLKWPHLGELSYVTMEEALSSKTLEITETTKQGSVPMLALNNKGDQRVFLMFGEELIGAKQNRSLYISIMVEAHSKLTIPVSCVQRGRWHYRSRRFHSDGSAAHHYLRKKMSVHAYESYRTTKRPFPQPGHQKEVWDEVDRKLAGMHCPSTSAELHRVYAHHKAGIEGILRHVQVPNDCCGITFGFAGEIQGLDIFDKPATLSKLMPKLVKAYGIDALEEGENNRQVESAEVEQWLKSLRSSNFDAFDSLGLGQDVRIDSENTTGFGLVVDNCPVHMMLFPERSYPKVHGTRRDNTTNLNLRTIRHDVAVLPVLGGTVSVVEQAVSTLRDVCAEQGIALRVGPQLGHDENGYSPLTGPHELTPIDEHQLVSRAYTRSPSQELRVLVTHSSLPDYWFSHWHQEYRTAVVSLYEWDRLSILPSQALVANSIVMHGLRVLSPSYAPEQLLHTETRGCLFDFCQNKRDVNIKLRTGDICGQCRATLEAIGLQTAQIFPMLDEVRRIALNR